LSNSELEYSLDLDLLSYILDMKQFFDMFKPPTDKICPLMLFVPDVIKFHKNLNVISMRQHILDNGLTEH